MIDLHLGDCLEVMKQIPDKTIDLIITSPPYFNAREYSHWLTYENYLDWCNLWIKETNRILVDGGILAVNSSAVITARNKRSEKNIRHNIPADLYEEKGFFDSHFVGYYSWIFDIPKGQKGSITQY
jgi:DNA modification methylase